MRWLTWGWSRYEKQAEIWATLVKIREARIEELEAEARSDAERIVGLESDLTTLQGQHANTQEANRAIGSERGKLAGQLIAKDTELKVRADLILQHGRTIAELQKQLAAVQVESARLQETAALRAAEIVRQRDEALAKCDEANAERDLAQKARVGAEKRVGHLEDKLARSQAEVTTLRATQGRLFDGLQRLLNEVT